VGNIINRVFESSGPEGKVRGTPQQIIEKYTQLARDSQLSNDRVAAENFQQHAEHYTRMLSEAMREMETQRVQNEQNYQGRTGDDRGDDRNDDRGDGQGDQNDSQPPHEPREQRYEPRHSNDNRGQRDNRSQNDNRGQNDGRNASDNRNHSEQRQHGENRSQNQPREPREERVKTPYFPTLPQPDDEQPDVGPEAFAFAAPEPDQPNLVETPEAASQDQRPPREAQEKRPRAPRKPKAEASPTPETAGE